MIEVAVGIAEHPFQAECIVIMAEALGIRIHPNDERPCIALASWLWDNGRDDEAAVVRVFWPTLRDEAVGGPAIEDVLEQMRRYRRLLGRRARGLEGD